MFAAKENGKAKPPLCVSEIFRAVVKDKEDRIADYSKFLQYTQQITGKLESPCSWEIAKVSQSAKDFSHCKAI